MMLFYSYGQQTFSLSGQIRDLHLKWKESAFMGTEQVSIHINLRSMSNCVKTEHYSLSLHKFRYGKGSLIKIPTHSDL